MSNRAEFSMGQKVNYWNGKKFIETAVSNLNLNPISNSMEYKLFYREAKTPGSKRSRIFVKAEAHQIKESAHFKG